MGGVAEVRSSGSIRCGGSERCISSKRCGDSKGAAVVAEVAAAVSGWEHGERAVEGLVMVEPVGWPGGWPKLVIRNVDEAVN